MKALDYDGTDHLIDKIYDLINSGGSADYIVEEGTSGIWTYRKWASGVAECWANQSFSVQQQGYQSQIYPFPTNFWLSGSDVTGTASGGCTNTVESWVKYVEVKPTSFILFMYNGSTSQQTATVFMQAKGFWKEFTPSAVQRQMITPNSYYWTYGTQGNPITTTSTNVLDTTNYTTATGKFLVMGGAAIFTSRYTSAIHIRVNGSDVCFAQTNQTAQQHTQCFGIYEGVKGQEYTVDMTLTSQDTGTTATIAAYTRIHFVIVDI